MNFDVVFFLKSCCLLQDTFDYRPSFGCIQNFMIKIDGHQSGMCFFIINQSLVKWQPVNVLLDAIHFSICTHRIGADLFDDKFLVGGVFLEVK